MLPRPLRPVLLALLLLSVVVLSVPFRNSSAADEKGKSSHQGRFAQTAQTLNQNSRREGPPNYDAFGASRKRATDAAAITQNAGQPQLQSGHLVQTEPRLGVPTFLWASETGQGQGKQLSANQAQAKVDIESAARGYLGDYGSLYRLSSTDVAAAKLVATHDTGKGVIIAKFRQAVGGVEVFRDEINVIMNRQLQLIALSGYLVGDMAGGAAFSAQSFTLRPAEALSKALQDLTGTSVDASLLDARGVKSNAGEMKAAATAQAQNQYLLFTADRNATQTNDGGFVFTGDPARVKQVLYHTVDGYVPAYYVETDVLVASNETNTVSLSGDAPTTELAYSYVISAADGQVLFRKNLIDKAGTPYTYRVWADPITRIPFDTPAGNDPEPKVNALPDGAQFPFVATNDITLANYPFSRNDPWLAPGATETVGNNADAYVDLFNPDGFNPAGTPADPATADFRAQTTGTDAFLHGYAADTEPKLAEARQAAIQQLFYDVNFLHDFFYDAGFDEAAGNAQASNYGRGGVENDRLKVEAQDVSGRNNSDSMLTPADGVSPRMQMFLFDSNSIKYFEVTSPAAAAGQRAVGTGTFGQQVFDLTNQVFQPSPAGGCTAASFTGAAGKFVLVDREPTSACSIGTKLNNAQAAGAAGFILVNLSSTPTQLVNVTGSLPTFTIPFQSISWNDAASIKTELAAANTVTARMRRDGGVDRDGAIDNQLVFHEWGHYLSNRLVANAGGLNTQTSSGLGEGWADFNAMLALTVRPDDILTPGNANWNGTYALSTYVSSGGANNGYYFGLRRYPYSTDMTKNPLTFRHIQDNATLPGGVPVNANQSSNAEAHNTGEVWATMLWECYASLLRDTVGPTPRLTFREAQERMKNYLVSALKMTPPQPTFLEARDALLASAKANDTTDYALFIQAFAKRGAGIGAIAPDRFAPNNNGVTESFDAIPEAVFTGATLDDSNGVSCDDDGVLDSGETGQLTVSIKNIGSTTLTGTTATISSTTPGVTFPNGGTINLPAFAPLSTASASVAVTLAPGLAGAQSLDFQISYSDPQLVGGARTASASFRGNTDLIPASTATDTVEAPISLWTITSVPPTIVTSGITQIVGAKTPWRRKEVTSLQHVWHVDDIGLYSDERLTSPIFTVDGSGSFNLQFDHSWGFEFDGGGNYDGGVIEMSVNGGAFTDLGGPAYNGVIFNGGTGNSNPLRGRNGFVKNSGGTIHTSLTQAIAPGSIVQIRFRVGSDLSFGSTGWDIDNIAFTGVVETPFTTLVAEAAICPVPPPPGPVQLQLTPNALPSGTLNSPYPLTVLTPSGGTGPYTYAITPFALPLGLVYDVVGGNLQISGTPLRGGNFPLTIVVNDSAGHQNTFNYPVTINKIAPVITWSNPADITYGTALSGTQLNASANVPGTLVYTPAAGTILNAGSNQTLSVSFTPTDRDTYSTTTQNVSINVLKATPTITWSNPSDITYGTALDNTQLNATAGVPGTITYTPPAGTVLDVGGSQTLTANFTPTDTTNYNGASQNVTINVLKATPVITWSNPSDITYGAALTAAQLNAVASVPGTITFSPQAGTFLNAGNNQTLTATFTPTDTVHYQSASKNVSINVLKADQTITFGALSPRTFGDAPFNLSATSSSGLPVSFQIFSGPASVNGNTVTITGAGAVTVRASVAPDANYNDAAPVDRTMTVAKADQTISFDALPSKTFGDAPFNLSATSTSNLPVSFQLLSGPASLSGSTLTLNGVGHVVVRANQAGDANYNAASNVIQAFDVVSANANISLSDLAYTYDGAAKHATVTTNPAGLSFTLTYIRNNPPAMPVAAPTAAGSYTVTATITDPNYQGSTTATLVINKATPIITWPSPAHITAGTPLSATQFNATANVPGAFQYNLPVGTVLSAGQYQLSTNFTPVDFSNYNDASKIVILIIDPAPLPVFSFSSSTYAVNEGDGRVAITVNRGGDASVAVIVNYMTSDASGLDPCSQVTGRASSRCDYATTIGTLRFAAGETSKTIFIPVVDDGFSEGSESFIVTLMTLSPPAIFGQPSVASVTINDNDATNGANPILNAAFFVRQQYIDFLGREPDPVGYQGWQDILKNCASGDTRCDRTEVSAGFFRSEEFQQRGYFIYRFYAASLGRIPHYSEFIPDLARVSGFLTPEQLEANKAAFIEEFMSRQEFQTKYGALTAPAAYVDALLQTAGLPNHPSRLTWITGLTDSTMTRAGVLRALIESPEVFNKYFNEAFVVMQYFGYLRRDPDIHYLEWIQIINQNGGDYRAMISGFMNSNEYVLRFGN